VILEYSAFSAVVPMYQIVVYVKPALPLHGITIHDHAQATVQVGHPLNHIGFAMARCPVRVYRSISMQGGLILVIEMGQYRVDGRLGKPRQLGGSRFYAQLMGHKLHNHHATALRILSHAHMPVYVENKETAAF